MDRKVWFITAFFEVDFTENPITIAELDKCGNSFADEFKATAFLKEIQMLRQKHE